MFGVGGELRPSHFFESVNVSVRGIFWGFGVLSEVCRSAFGVCSIMVDKGKMHCFFN